MFAKINATDLARVIPFAAKQDVRYYLNGVYVDVTDSGVILVATNGHILAAMKSEGSEAERSFILSATDPMRLAVKRAGKSLLSFVQVETPQSRAEVVMSPMKSGATEVSYIQPCQSEIDGKYPEWRKVIPPDDQLAPGLPAGYQSKYLRMAIELIESLPGSKYGNGVMFSHYATHPKDGAVIAHCDSTSGQMIVAIMPMRLSTESPTVPAWARTKSEPTAEAKAA